jgi:hypothetical protein
LLLKRTNFVKVIERKNDFYQENRPISHPRTISCNAHLKCPADPSKDQEACPHLPVVAYGDKSADHVSSKSSSKPGSVCSKAK